MVSKPGSTDQLRPGQRWFVKINSAVALLRAEIMEITECTVVLMEPGNFDMAARYKLDDVEFVEQIIAPPHQTATIEPVRKIR